MGAARAGAQADQYSHSAPELVSEAADDYRGRTCRVCTIASYTAALGNRTVLTNGAGLNRHPSLPDVFTQDPAQTGLDFDVVRAASGCSARSLECNGPSGLAGVCPLPGNHTPILGSASNERRDIHGRACKVLRHARTPGVYQLQQKLEFLTAQMLSRIYGSQLTDSSNP